MVIWRSMSVAGGCGCDCEWGVGDEENRRLGVLRVGVREVWVLVIWSRAVTDLAREDIFMLLLVESAQWLLGV